MNFTYSLLCFSLLFYCFVNCVIIHTKQGTLKGEVSKSRGGREFFSFYGIPYAAPPVGELRFKSPVPAEKWQGIRDATILPPKCITSRKNLLRGREDCLYLNVYTPTIKNDSLLPVILHTFGGRFMYEDALPDKYGPHYFMDKDIILITYHFRIGIFGFLSTEDEIIPGNFGLKDSVAALQWIQSYIEDFGGDKSRVTISGDSSGGTSASLVLTSPLAEGLFHRVIADSGPVFDVLKPGAASLSAWKLASLVGCSGDEITTSKELLDCLTNLPAEDIASHNEDLYSFGILLPCLPWGPVIENEKVPGAFLVDEPAKLIQRKSDIPWLFGMTSGDGGMIPLLHKSLSPPSVKKELNENYKKYLPLIFRYGFNLQNDTALLDQSTEILKNHYFGENSISEDVRGFSKMWKTTFYLFGVRDAVKLYQGPKYVYYYDHRNKESFAHTYGKTDVDMGVMHGDELISFYNWSSVITPVTEGVDLVVSKHMIDFWFNFAANGNPNNADELLWKEVQSSDVDYLYIKNGEFSMKNGLLQEEYDFLKSLPADIGFLKRNRGYIREEF